MNLLRVAGDGFNVFPTDHFVIASDTSPAYVRSLVAHLEETYDSVSRFCRERLNLDHPIIQPLPVLVFDRWDRFQDYASSLNMPTGEISGFYDEGNNITALVNVTSMPKLQAIHEQLGERERRLDQQKDSKELTDADEQGIAELAGQIDSLRSHRDTVVQSISRLVVRHETAHQVLFNFGVFVRGGASPRWLVEGLACQFEHASGDPSGRNAGFNPWRLADLRETPGWPASPNTHPTIDREALFGDGGLVEMSEFISDPGLFRAGQSGTPRLYAQAWGLVYFLQCEEVAALPQYLRHIGRRKANDAITPSAEMELFRSFFGPPDEAFERRWIEFLHARAFDPPDSPR